MGGKVWLGVLMLTIELSVSHVPAQGQGSATKIDRSLAPYDSSAHSVRLSDGRVIHLTCSGHGAPTVILTDGAGGWGIHWAKVQPLIATKTRVCAWDRAGFGLSSASPLPQTVANTTSDLEAALALGRIKGPYVLVGHSAGAYETLLMADRRLADVVGIGLVDPSIPDQAARFKRVAPSMPAWWVPSDQQAFVKSLQKCAIDIRAGRARSGGPDPDQCLTPPPIPAEYPPQLRKVISQQGASATAEIMASIEDTIASSHAFFDENSKTIASSHRAYGNMPLIVLTAGEAPLAPDASQVEREEMPLRQAEWLRGHDEYAALSTRGVNRIIPESGHIIQWDKPQAVVDAVAEVVDAARQSNTSASSPTRGADKPAHLP